MLAPLLVTLREGLEATLILGIIMAYLTRTGNGRRSGPVWLGAALALLVSLLVGAAVFFTVGEMEGTGEQLFEGTALFLAVALLTYMVVWMRHQATGIRAGLQERVQAALRSGSGFALALMAFVVVVREGIEAALFFFAASQTSTSMESMVGGLVGLILAAVFGYSLYRGSHLMKLGTFFNVTGFLLIIVGAGLLAHGVHEYQEVGFLPEIVDHVWNTNWLVSGDSTAGQLLSALVGYNGSPSLLEVLAYVAYLGISLTYYFRSAGGQPRARQAHTRQAA